MLDLVLSVQSQELEAVEGRIIDALCSRLGDVIDITVAPFSDLEDQSKNRIAQSDVLLLVVKEAHHPSAPNFKGTVFTLVISDSEHSDSSPGLINPYPIKPEFGFNESILPVLAEIEKKVSHSSVLKEHGQRKRAITSLILLILGFFILTVPALALAHSARRQKGTRWYSLAGATLWGGYFQLGLIGAVFLYYYGVSPVLARLAEAESEGNMQRWFATYHPGADKDGDGVFSADEMEAHYERWRLDRWLEANPDADSDSDGTLTTSEWQSYVNRWRSDARRAQASFKEGQTLVETGKLDESLPSLNRACHIYFKYYQFNASWGKTELLKVVSLLEENGHYHSARSVVGHLIKRDEKKTGRKQRGLMHSLTRMAEIYQKEGKEFGKALELYDRVIEIERSIEPGGLPSTYINKASLLVDMQRLEEASELAEQAFTLWEKTGYVGPMITNFLNKMGEAYANAGNPGKAEECLNRALKHETKSTAIAWLESDSFIPLVEFYINQMRFDDAEKHLKQAISNERKFYGWKSNHVAFLRLAQAYIRLHQGKPREAEKITKGVIKGLPAEETDLHALSQLLLAEAAVELNQISEAESHLRQVPDDSKVVTEDETMLAHFHYCQASIYFNSGKVKEGFEHANKALEWMEKNPTKCPFHTYIVQKINSLLSRHSQTKQPGK